MELELLSPSQSPATLSLWWDGLQVQLLMGERSLPHSAPNHRQIISNPVDLVSLCRLVETAATRTKSAVADSENLDTLVTSFGIKYKLSLLDISLARQLKAVLLPCNYYECTISNPSILHLLHLLQTEMQTPQLMNQMFVSSIVTVLTTYLLQHLQQSENALPS